MIKTIATIILPVFFVSSLLSMDEMMVSTESQVATPAMPVTAAAYEANENLDYQLVGGIKRELNDLIMQARRNQIRGLPLVQAAHALKVRAVDARPGAGETRLMHLYKDIPHRFGILYEFIINDLETQVRTLRIWAAAIPLNDAQVRQITAGRDDAQAQINLLMNDLFPTEQVLFQKLTAIQQQLQPLYLP